MFKFSIVFVKLESVTAIFIVCYKFLHGNSFCKLLPLSTCMFFYHSESVYSVMNLLIVNLCMFIIFVLILTDSNFTPIALYVFFEYQICLVYVHVSLLIDIYVDMLCWVSKKVNFPLLLTDKKIKYTTDFVAGHGTFVSEEPYSSHFNVIPCIDRV